MTYDPLESAKSRVAEAEARLAEAKSQLLVAQRAFNRIPPWRLWARIGANAEVKDLGFQVTHEAMNVVRAKAHAWDTLGRTQL